MVCDVNEMVCDAKGTAASRSEPRVGNGGLRNATVEDYVVSNRSEFDTDGRYAVEDVLLPTASST